MVAAWQVREGCDLSWNTSLSGYLQSDWRLTSCFSSCPTQMSIGKSCVAPVWFTTVLSIWSVNNIPWVKTKTVRPKVTLKKTDYVATGRFSKEKCCKLWSEMSLISFSWADNANNNIEYLWSLGVFCSTVHYQSECVLATFLLALNRSMCGFISSNSNVLCNIWWDYLRKLSSLGTLEVSSCRLRNTLIKLIAFILLIKLLNCVVWNKKHIFEDFLGIVAHFSGSSLYGKDPTAKNMIGFKTRLSTERQEGTGRSEPGLLKIPRHHLLHFVS